tara:strand:- start:1238 stop:1609 length:372 start_codon:yes stop_codon:yes gene_type:complete
VLPDYYGFGTNVFKVSQFSVYDRTKDQFLTVHNFNADDLNNLRTMEDPFGTLFNIKDNTLSHQQHSAQHRHQKEPHQHSLIHQHWQQKEPHQLSHQQHSAQHRHPAEPHHISHQHRHPAKPQY